MEALAVMGFILGMSGFAFGITALTNSNKVKELEKRIDDLEKKS